MYKKELTNTYVIKSLGINKQSTSKNPFSALRSLTLSWINAFCLFDFSGVNVGPSGETSLRLRPALTFNKVHADIFLEILESTIQDNTYKKPKWYHSCSKFYTDAHELVDLCVVVNRWSASRARLATNKSKNMSMIYTRILRNF